MRNLHPSFKHFWGKESLELNGWPHLVTAGADIPPPSSDTLS